MENKKPPITITASVKAPISKVWEYWSEPSHITKWNAASDDWHSPKAQNDLRAGGTFSITMAAKDGSASFDFSGTYSEVVHHKSIAYEMPDGRKVFVEFRDNADSVDIVETFDPENTNDPEFQRQGWQAILDSFKRYAEGNN